MWTVAEGSKGEFRGEGGLEELPAKLRGVVERMMGDGRWCIYGGARQGATVGMSNVVRLILEPLQGYGKQGFEQDVEDERKGRLPVLYVRRKL